MTDIAETLRTVLDDIEAEEGSLERELAELTERRGTLSTHREAVQAALAAVTGNTPALATPSGAGATRPSPPPYQRPPAAAPTPREPRIPLIDSETGEPIHGNGIHQQRRKKGVAEAEVHEAFASKPGKTLSTRDLSGLTGQTPGSLKQLLARLSAEKKLTRVSAGHYRANGAGAPTTPVPLESLGPMQAVPFTQERARSGGMGGIE